jgi:hypothetical protein
MEMNLHRRLTDFEVPPDFLVRKAAANESYDFLLPPRQLLLAAAARWTPIHAQSYLIHEVAHMQPLLDVRLARTPRA